MANERCVHIVKYKKKKTDGENMQKKLPYYMVYPMPFSFDDERMDEKDTEYMKSLYPDVAKRLLPYVEEECDRMEYQNSMMYDEYPDRLQLRMMCSRVYDRVKKNEKIFFGTGYEDLLQEEPGEDQKRAEGNRQKPGKKRGYQEWLRDLVEVMVYQELLRRRRDNRRSSVRSPFFFPN